METGLYESLITSSLQEKLSHLDPGRFFIADQRKLDTSEAVHFLSLHLSQAITGALSLISENKELLVSRQIEVANSILKHTSELIASYDFSEDLIEAQGAILEGVYDRITSDFTDLSLYLKEITPSTRLIQSELFTGGNQGISLDSELKKEIRSSNRVDLLVSFIKWKAIVLLRDALEEFTNSGGKLRVITTTYMGATDLKAIEELSKLSNTEVKISYNTSNERLHAKAYLFYRNTGFHTGYIGSSNFSRSALTDGLEWNVKVTTKEIPHIISKFQKTFEAYWNSPEFELFNTSQTDRLQQALKASTFKGKMLTTFFDLKPYHYQQEILEKLRVERAVHNSYRNLVVAATGTGKTMISAFDFKEFLKENPQAKLLFVAHRMEILQQARNTFRAVLKKDNNYGELLGQGYVPDKKNVLFSTVQSLNNKSLQDFATRDYYDYIVIDEAHHISAQSYQSIMNYFTPKIFLGLTATPERMDGESILPYFNHRLAGEIRLPDALSNKLLCPFQYFGVSDNVDYTAIGWNKGRYDSTELTTLYLNDEKRVHDVIFNLQKYTKDINEVCCLGFCVSIKHAEFMASRFKRVGLRADFLTSENADSRDQLLQKLKRREINYLFVVDIFNEGVDIPEVDTVLFLRPTESLTIFLQQLGRGLRLSEGKEVLTVLDFVGLARPEYDFEKKFRALVGKTTTSIKQEVESDFPQLPPGSAIILEKRAKEIILENISRATSIRKSQLTDKMLQFRTNSSQDLNLENFLSFYNLEEEKLYDHYLFWELEALAFRKSLNGEDLSAYRTMIRRKWAVTESLDYFQWILQFIDNSFSLQNIVEHPKTEKYALMLYYDFYKRPKQKGSLENALLEIGRNTLAVKEMKDYLRYRISKFSIEEIPLVTGPSDFPLMIHGRYTRDHILVAMEQSTWEKKSGNIAGVAYNKEINTEALFINLHKSEKHFSPTTMFDDYAINDILFHWQSQNQVTPESEKGQLYINQQEKGVHILLFVREAKHNALGSTQGYVFLGPAKFVEASGSRPMSIRWKLEEPLPPFLWKESAKLLVG